MTTILGRYHKKNLDHWHKRVGKERAKQILTQAGARGTEVHEICEQYILNDQDYRKNKGPVNLDTFKPAKALLDKHVTRVYGVEYPVFSHKLMTAGTIDLLCDWDGVPTVLDYKTSLRKKKEEWITNYFEQSTVYSIMATQKLKIPFHQFVIIMMIDYESPVIYKKPVFDYVKQVKEIFIDSRKV